MSVPLTPSWRPSHRQSPTRIGESWEVDIRHLQSRTRFLLFCNSSTKLGRFSANVAVKTDTFSQQVPERHHFQVEKLVLDCMGWILLVKNSRISNYHVGNREVLDKCFWLDSEGSRMIYWKSHLIVTVPLAISDDVKQQSLITTFVNLQDLIAVLVKIDSFVDRSRCKNEKYLDLISCLTCSRITIHYC